MMTMALQSSFDNNVKENLAAEILFCYICGIMAHLCTSASRTRMTAQRNDKT